MEEELRYRQVHLDFHTSEFVPDVAIDFDAEEFGETLLSSNVDSITCFARCHHGWLYYPSINNPELIHPTLKNKNLLIEQIRTCHKRNIKVPIYTTVQWDKQIAKKHPEWLAVDATGSYVDFSRRPEPHFYYTICLNSGYRQYLFEHIQDIVDVIGEENIDGFFLDIVFEVDCHCENCKKEMCREGFNPEDEKDRMEYMTFMPDKFKREMSQFIKERVPHTTIFYNSGHVDPKIRSSLDSYTHFELESLPGGAWGYDHFPATVRYARRLGKPVLGMTGKFHTEWGDFHSLKNKAALEFECFNMLALGAGCSIGDQLHPNGKLSPSAYELIGSVYKKIEKMEAYSKNSQPVVEIGVLTPEEYPPESIPTPEEHTAGGGSLPSRAGAVKMLQELSYQFDIIDSKMNFNEYSLIILPDQIQYSVELEKKLFEYIANGGKVIATHHSLMKKEGSISKLYGNRWLGDSEFDVEFILPNSQIGKDLFPEEYVMYLKGAEVETVDAEILMTTIKPYFNREGEKFCSHRHTPSSGIAGSPAVTRKNNVIYFSHPIFSIYSKNAPSWCKAIIKDALGILLEKQLIVHNGPSTLLTSLHENKQTNIKIVHLLHYIIEKKSEEIHTIEEKIPLFQLECEVYVGGMNVRDVRTALENNSISFAQNGEFVTFTIEKLDGHLMLIIDGERN